MILLYNGFNLASVTLTFKMPVSLLDNQNELKIINKKDRKK